ncbi:MAG: hypothetical protein KAR06_00450 [Deltaproteobacteria bacterium]|nr:hypothetical protein [Deltaproteobacteria bacterium]
MLAKIEWTDSVFENYAKKYIARNLWKYQRMGYEFEDLLQESWIAFDKCLDTYGDSIDEQKHLMSLFKMTLHNLFYDIAKKASAEKKAVVEGEILEEVHGGIQGDGLLSIYLKEAPKEVRDVLHIIFSLPRETASHLGLNKKHKKGIMTNQALCKMLGYNPNKINLMKEVENYISCFT